MRTRLCSFMHTMLAAEQDFLFSFNTSIYWIFYEHADFFAVIYRADPLKKIIERHKKSYC